MSDFQRLKTAAEEALAGRSYETVSFPFLQASALLEIAAQMARRNELEEIKIGQRPVGT